MDRRHFIGALGTVGVSAGGLWLAYQLDQGNLTLGKDSDISATVSGGPESFEFEAQNGADIRVTVTDTRDPPYSGSFTLEDPDGNDVLNGGPRSSEIASRTHTAERRGTYRLVVNLRGTNLRVNVLIQGPSEG